MRIKLANGTHRVQIRKAGFPKIDQVFISLKAAAKSENLKREKSDFGPKALRPIMLFAEPVEPYQQSLAFSKEKDNTQKTERLRIKRALEAVGE